MEDEEDDEEEGWIVDKADNPFITSAMNCYKLLIRHVVAEIY